MINIMFYWLAILALTGILKYHLPVAREAKKYLITPALIQMIMTL